MAANAPRVLSIQSHVVSGYVGNKCATFPLQLLGFDVDPINSVQFSNHTGYKKIAGQILNETDLKGLVDGLAENGLDFYSHLLTGYIGSESFLKQIADVIRHLRQINPNITYVCDPVMGDNGRMYVPKELLPIYKETIIPLANIITPNQYEAELLTDMKFNNMNDAWKGIEKLHDKGPQTVVLSSTDLGSDDYLIAVASQKLRNSRERVLIKVPKLPVSFTGTGDIFAALFLSWMYRTDNKLKESLEKTVASLQAILKRTYEFAKDNISPKTKELKLVQSKKDIEEPQVVINAENC